MLEEYLQWELLVIEGMLCILDNLRSTPLSSHIIREEGELKREGTVSKADSRFAPSQWETALLCNDVSHWLGANLESALCEWYQQNGRHFTDDIFKHIFYGKNVGISTAHLLKFLWVMDQTLALVQVMAWRRTGAKFDRAASPILDPPIILKFCNEHDMITCLYHVCSMQNVEMIGPLGK